MGNIVLLDDLTINKIAAGEVIERPASVVKEMVENSIDAGAKNITVEIKNGGISLIKITDDGCGIAEDDMEIAFERHATSKIRRAEDLSTVKSMGFRGEALASIAAISNVEMISKKADSEVAHKIVVEGGKTLEFTEAARSVGTTITVQNLFYNTPVRYKFLKKDFTEAGYIEDAVTRIALVNKDVAIKLISNGKTIIQTNGNGDLKTLIYSIYGKDIASEIIEVNYEYEGMKVTGVIGKPVIARANRANQLFFLNGRYIKDKNLSAAADQAYKGMIPVGRYGFIVLNLEMDPKLVDVNVHPAKLEVRFEDEGKVFKAVYHAIKSNLAQSELVENVEKEQAYNTNFSEEKNQRTIISSENKIEEKTRRNIEETKESTPSDEFAEEKKKGLAGLFSKIIKEPEETKEEINNNYLDEIFKYRQGLKNNSYAEQNNVKTSTEEPKVEEKHIEEPAVNLAEDKTVENSFTEKTFVENPPSVNSYLEKLISDKTINDTEVSKKVSLGETIISSDTREIDVTTVNDMIKEATTEMVSTKLMSQENTQIIEPANVTPVVPQETAVIENVKDKLKENISSNNLESTNLNENMSNSETSSLNSNISESAKANIEDNGFSKIAEQLVEAKLNLENTQMVDTVKVREAINSDIPTSPEFDEMYRKTFGVDTVSVRKEKEQEKLEQEKLNAAKDFNYATENLNVFDDNEEVSEIKYKYLGIAFSTYIIIEIKNEMYIIDQHAAHERIMYERIKENYYSDSEKDEQFLLLPDVINLTHKEMTIARENIEMFARAGFSFEEFGENTIKLMSVPSMCEDLNTKQLFLDILDEIDTVAVTARQEKEDKFIATVACKAAVKGNMKLDEQEVNSLMKTLLELPNPFTCPHGRPTAIKMTKYDLERKFSRR